jgi:hypothetical protein
VDARRRSTRDTRSSRCRRARRIRPRTLVHALTHSLSPPSLTTGAGVHSLFLASHALLSSRCPPSIRSLPLLLSFLAGGALEVDSRRAHMLNSCTRGAHARGDAESAVCGDMRCRCCSSRCGAAPVRATRGFESVRRIAMRAALASARTPHIHRRKRGREGATERRIDTQRNASRVTTTGTKRTRDPSRDNCSFCPSMHIVFDSFTS